MAWHHLLLDAGHRNPAIFAFDYTLVPDARYPTQVLETLQGYEHVLQEARDASRVCVAGDSAGATLVLSLLLKLGAQASSRDKRGQGGRTGCWVGAMAAHFGHASDRRADIAMDYTQVQPSLPVQG